MDTKELGLLKVDCGDVACIPIGGLAAIMGRAGGDDVDAFVDWLNAVRVRGGEVHSLTACNEHGGTYPAVAIGLDPTGLRSHSLGNLGVIGIAVSRDDLLRLLRDRGVAGVGEDDIDGLLGMCGGIECGFDADGGYGVDSVRHDGQEFTTIGLNDDVVRFLRGDEQDFGEWYKENPPPDCGHGEDFDEGKWNAHAERHRELIRQGNRRQA